jgi:hypothetical protein
MELEAEGSQTRRLTAATCGRHRMLSLDAEGSQNRRLTATCGSHRMLSQIGTKWTLVGRQLG